jgi:protein-tyrosine phosphatase
MTDGRSRILVVCVGNLCRSPVAERLIDLRLSEAALDGLIEVGSAGVRAVTGSPMHPRAAAELERLGGDPADFSARRLEDAGMGEAELVLTATKELRREALGVVPRAMRRTVTILELATIVRGVSPQPLDELAAFAGANRHLALEADIDLPDPIGQDQEVHRLVADRIDESVRSIVGSLVSRP